MIIIKYLLHEQHRKDTELSNEHWSLKELNASPRNEFGILYLTEKKEFATCVYLFYFIYFIFNLFQVDNKIEYIY